MIQRWQRAWNGSLRFRLLALGLMPLLVAFPVVIAVLLVVGGEGTRSLLQSNMRSNLAGTRNYLNQLKTEAGVRVDQLVKSDRLITQFSEPGKSLELNQALAAAARGGGFDFLLIALQDGTVVGSSSGVASAKQLPDSYVIRQARIGVATAAFERYEADQLDALSAKFRDEAGIALPAHGAPEEGIENRGLLINAAAHFPLTVDHPDAILVGGILLNKNSSLIEHLREIIFPVGALPGDAEGMNAIYLDDVRIAVSRQRQQGLRPVGMRAEAEVAATVLEQGEPWLGKLNIGNQSYFVGYEPIVDGDGRRIGMVEAGFPEEPYRQVALILVGVITLLMAATMLVISVVFLRAGRELTQGLAGISSTMTLVGSGNRAARVGSPVREDELGQLSRDFNGLLDLITHQEEMRRAALQTIADEASRRRALFEHERDGVVILNPDGSVFEANPQCLTMLGYRAAEMQQLHLGDWEMQPPPAKVQQLLLGVGPPGTQYETVHRRKDGSTYAAEVSISRVAWADHTFVLASQRDITERKLTEVELERYRQGLEVLVEQRTKELNDRGEQLNAIFALSPDGFVSFDRELRVSFVNASFLRMTALASGEILGLDETAFSDLLARRCVANAHFPGVARLRSAREKVGADGTAPDTGSGRRQSFELLPPASRVLEVGIRLAETENVSQILYFRDITHETEVDRMKSEFLSTAAHELRTPMASIYGYTELLMMQDFDEDMRKEMLGTIYRQSELISSIVNELLDLARIEARQGKDFVIERILLGELVDHARAAYKPPAGREAPVVEVCPPGHAIHADRKKMQQALLNILSNAYKYSPQGGPVSIACRLDAGPAGLRAGIEVRDQGIGMTPDQLSHIFERFYRADTSGKIPGTGLGMSIVKEITELHGGSVEVASTPGAGTRVTLWIAMA